MLGLKRQDSVKAAGVELFARAEDADAGVREAHVEQAGHPLQVGAARGEQLAALLAALLLPCSRGNTANRP